MTIRTLIKRSEYHDSVSLMLVARELAGQPGLTDVAVVMATEANKGILKEAGLLNSEAEAASPNDLVIAVAGDDSALDAALAEAEKLLKQKQTTAESGAAGEYRPRTLRGAVKAASGANVAVISVSGRYAADEAWEALHNSLHVLLFSDNVSLADEIALKRYAAENGLLLMGPGAGTAILNGVALGFANQLPRGPVGIVSAAGTGLQEVSTLLAKTGVGITQGIGTGGRDLKEEVGGIMMLEGLKALQQDPATEVIVLVSKPPAPMVAQKVLDQVGLSPKPTVVCLLGGDTPTLPNPKHVISRTLEEAARAAASFVGGGAGSPRFAEVEAPGLSERADEIRRAMKPGQSCLRGLFSGGTLCYEAQVIWRDRLKEPVMSNAPLNPAQQMLDSTRSVGHTAVDLGEEEFTVGRLHPMIDNDLRVRRLLQEARDPETAVIVLDVVIGYGAHPDPGGVLAAAVEQARVLRPESDGPLSVIASVTGTEADPQRLGRQVQALEAVGVVVCPSNAAAARLVAAVVGGIESAE